MVWLVIWVVLMMFWLFGGGYYAYNLPNHGPVIFGASTLIPWLCVLILGLIIFGGITVTGPTVIR
jgi:hypothetical protein